MGHKFALAAAVLRANNYISLHNAAAAGIPEAEELGKAWEFEHPMRSESFDETELSVGLSAQQRGVRRKRLLGMRG